MSATGYHLGRAIALARHLRDHLHTYDKGRAMGALDHLIGTLDAALDALRELEAATAEPSSPEARDVLEWLRAIDATDHPPDRAKAWQEIEQIARDMALDEAERAAEETVEEAG